MFKKILLSAAALSGLVLFASQADAGYGYGYSYKHYKPHYRSYSYHKPHCYSVTKPVTIACGTTIPIRISTRRSIATTGSATSDPVSPGAPHRLGQLGLPSYPPRAAALLIFAARVSSSLPN
jgi:hypothetical protein